MDEQDFPTVWRWPISKLCAADADPATPAHIRDELRRFLQAAQAEMDNEPGLLLWRAHQDELESMIKGAPGLADANVPLDEFVDALRAHRSYGSSKAAKAKAKGKPAWHAEAKRERDRLIAQGTAPRDVASKIARLAAFAAYSEHAIRNAIRQR